MDKEEIVILREVKKSIHKGNVDLAILDVSKGVKNKKEVFKKAFKLLTDNGVLVLTGEDNELSAFRDIGKEFWKYNFIIKSSSKKEDAYFSVCVFAKTNSFCFNQKDEPKPSGYTELLKAIGFEHRMIKADNLIPYIPSVLKYNCLEGDSLNQVPKAFIRDMITMFSNKKDTVLENFTNCNNISYTDVNLTRRFISISGGVIETLENKDVKKTKEM